MRITEITISKPSGGDQVFVLQANLQKQDGFDINGNTKFKETSIVVQDIQVVDNLVSIVLSDGKTFAFNGYPYVLVIEE